MLERRGLLLVLVAAVATLAFAPSAIAATFTVNDTGDAGDATPDGTCDGCTLREAIEEANANGNDPTLDTINFDNTAGNFDGVAANATIAPTIGLDGLGEPVAVAGGNCGTAGAPKPCVGLDAANAGNPFSVSAANVAISGVAIFGNASSTGVFGGAGSSGLEVTNMWFGLQLDESVGEFNRGILLQDAGAQIGGTAAADRNVFAESVSEHIRVQGPDNSKIQGNYFGTEPDGTNIGATTPTAVKVFTQGGEVPTGTVIGGEDTGAATSCDSACNLFANTSLNAIDLTDSGATGPAGETNVEGNYFGLSVSGSAQLGTSAGNGVAVGDADDVTVGGAGSGFRNYLGTYPGGGIGTGSGALDLIVRNNFVGLNDAGTARIGDGGSVTVGATTDAPAVSDNRIAADASTFTVALNVGASNSSVTGNVVGIGTGGQNVGGAEIAINIGGADNTVGGAGAGEGNVVGNTDGGISVGGGDGNTVAGNRIGTDATETQAHPITNTGINVNGPDDNTIGGDTAAEENVIENVGGDAIKILGDGTDFNSVLRNRGSAAPSGEFIDLTPNEGPGVQALGANEAIAAPTIDPGPTSEAVSGTGAELGATVRVYRTLSADGSNPDDIEAFVGEDVADASGDWSVACPGGGCAAEMPGSGQVTANQTDTSGNSSELATSESYTAVAPNTTITSGPAQGSTTADTTPTFGFSSSEAGSTFQCKVDGGSFASCSSPRTLSSLSDGQHTFQVRAVDTGGNQDGSPASRTFTVDVPTPPDTRAPQTTITKAPKAKLKAKKKTAKAIYEFSSDEGGSSFECSLDGDAFAPCTSPHTEKVKKGKHSFEVRAKDAAGNVDGTPAEDAFKVVKKKKK